MTTQAAMRIARYATGSIEDSVEQQQTHRKWAIDGLLQLKKAFGPRLPALAKTDAAER